ncbi:flagellar biosynthetic protein FliR [Anaerobacillus sp. MEB173]|uniref:flagellar biosynthetic protein FliR n=1 Tax=Anaerobacillus sp. MEB173 TaxID=3383345 RepID=UPI003F92BFA0
MEFINQFPAFLLIFVRVTSFFITMPIFSYRNIPTIYKLGLGFFLAWMMFLTLDPPHIPINSTYYLLIFKEVFIGVTIGLVAMTLLYAIQVAGGFIDMTMGFMIANVIDPQTGAQSPLIGGYLYTFALLFLLAMDGHHLLLDGIFYSYQFIPLEQLFIPFGNESLIYHIVTTFNTMIIIALQMAIPIVGSLFLVNVTLGMISRAVPQMNVFVVGLPLQISVGLILITIFLPVFFMMVRNLFDKIIITMRILMQLIGGV